MSNEQLNVFSTMDALKPELMPARCELDAEGHCITCSDEAQPFRVVQVDEAAGIAFVTVNEANNATEEIDITLVEDVVPGSVLLVHGGVAIAHITDTRISDRDSPYDGNEGRNE